MIFIVKIAFILLEQKKPLKVIKKYFKNKDFCNVIMPSEDTKTDIKNLIKLHFSFMQILNV